MKSSVHRCVLCVPRSMCFKEPSKCFMEHYMYVKVKYNMKKCCYFSYFSHFLLFFSLFSIFSQFGKNSMLSGCNLTFHVNELTKNSVQFPWARDYSMIFLMKPSENVVEFLFLRFFCENVENLFFLIFIQFPKMILHIIS